MNRLAGMGLLAAGLVTAPAARAQSMSKPYKTVTAERVIDAPPGRVWEAMVGDYGEIANFSPYIYASTYENGSLEGTLGAERKCHFNAQGTRWSHERIAEIDPESMTMKNVIVDAAKFPLNLDNSYALYQVRDNGDGTSTASYTFHYRTTPGFMTGLVKGNFQKTLDGTLIGLEHYVETGERVNATTGNFAAIEKLAKQSP